MTALDASERQVLRLLIANAIRSGLNEGYDHKRDRWVDLSTLAKKLGDAG